MAIDFRPPEERGQPASPRPATSAPSHSPAGGSSATSPAPPAAARRLMLGALYAAALGFIAAGVAVLLLRPALLGQEVSLYLGAALVLAGLFDIVAAQLLRAVWARAQRSRR